MQRQSYKCVQALAYCVSLFAAAGTASAQVNLVSPSSTELVGASVSIQGTGYPAGTINANAVNVTVTPAAGSGSPVTFCLAATCATAGVAPGGGTLTAGASARTLAFILPAGLTANLPYTASVSVAGKTSTNVSFSTATPATITINPAGSISNVSPGAGQVGTAVPVTITGLYTHFSQATSALKVGGTATVQNCASVVIAGSTAITPCNMQVTGSTPTTQTMTATFMVGTNVTPGVYPVTVTSNAEVATLPVGFVVTASAGLSFSAINPNSGAQGTTINNVDVQGINTHFAQGVTTANFGNGITINSIVVNTPTDMTVSLSINSLAPAGGRIVTVVTGGEFAMATNGFTVTTSGASIISATPTTPVPQGGNASLTLTGVGTHWTQSGTVVNFGGGINTGSITVNSNTSLTVNISVGPGVAAGIYGVTATTAGEVATLSNAVTVSAATPLISGVAPTTAAQGTNNLNVVVSGTNTSFNVGAISADFGPLITVNSVTPNGALQATINISISPVAVAGGRSVTLTSDGTLFNFNFTVTPSTATVTSVTPNSGLQQSSYALTVTGSGTHWVQGTTVASLGDTNITINEVTINNPQSATVNITLGAQAGLGLHTLTMTTGGEVASEANAFTVLPFTPSMSLSPSSGMIGTVVNVNFNGNFTNFTPGTTVANIDGVGVAIQNFMVLGKSTATAQFVIASDAPASPAYLCTPGNRTVTVTTGTQIVTAPFCVTSTPAVLISITPSQSPQNNNLNVTITGQYTNFQNATLTTPGSNGTAPTTLGFGPDITVNTLTINSATSLSANITVAANAALGWRQAFVNTGAEQLTIGFLIAAPASASLVSVSPSAGQQGQTISGVTITGNLTNFMQGTTLAILGAGITVSDLQILSPTVATATIAISPTTPVGVRTVEMITGVEDVSGPLFTVNQGVASISFTPNCNNNFVTAASCAPTLATVAQGGIVPFNVTGTGTHFVQGETTMDFGGSDIEVTQLTVNSPTSITGQIVVSYTAAIGFRMATATTGGEVAPTSSFAVDVVQTTPTLLNLSVNSAPQGTSHLQVQINGQLTNWLNGTTTASFGNNNGLVVNSVTVTSATQATIDLTILGTAYTGLYSVTVNTQHGGGNIEQETLSSVFSVTTGAAIITQVNPVSAAQGSTVDVVITGQNTSWINGTTTAYFTTGSCISSPNPGINSGLPTVSTPTSATLSIAISPTAQTGLQTLCMATLGELVSFQNSFTITPSTPTLNEVSPVSAEQGQQVTVNLLGQFTHWQNATLTTPGSTGTAPTTVTFGEGITLVGSLNVTSTTTATATILVSPLASIGVRNVVVDTPIGSGYETVQGTNFFSVTAGPAILSSVSPNTGNQGTHILMQVTGEFTHWSQELSQVTINGAGYDITINGVQVQSPTSLLLDMNISGTATLGTRTVYVSTGGENVTLQNGFLITGGVPSISGISPSSVQQGATSVNVQIGGIFTQWDNTTQVSFGPNITFGTPQWTVNSNTSITAIINVAANAPLGLQTVTVQTGSQILTTSINILSGAPPTPYISYEYPSVALVGQTLDVNLVGQYTHWLPENPSDPSNPYTQITFGAGIVVNNFQVTGENTAVANITIVPTAALGTNTVTMTTGAEVETTSFTITVGTPAITLISPNSIIQGQTLDVDIVGQYTTFNNNPGTATVFKFGSANSQITVNSVTLFGPTAARVNISAGIEAPLGGLTVSETSGSEVAYGGFSVTPSQATITAVTPNTAPQGTVQIINVTGFATNWVQGTTVFSLGGFGITNVTVNGPTSAQMTVTIPPGAGVGEYSISATTVGEYAYLNNAFVVTPGTPILVSDTGGSAQQGTNFSVQIIGQVTNFIAGWPAAGATSVNLGAGVNVTGVDVTSSLGVTVTGNVDPTTFTGYRNVTVTTGAQGLVLFNGFDVTPGTAQITQLSPASGSQGQALQVAITGTNTHFQQGVTQANFGQGIQVTGLTVSDETDAMANITILPTAVVTQNSVTLTTLGETATSMTGFTIIAATPVIDFISPTSLRQGQTAVVTITGSFTSFTNSSVVSFGTADITVKAGSVSASSGQSLTATVVVSPTALLGARTVSVDGVSLVNGFNVTSDAATGGTFTYTANSGGANLSGYISDPGTGILTVLSDSPYGAGSSPQKVIASPSGYSVYAVNQADTTVSVYSLNAATGTLTQVTGSPVSAGPSPANLTFAPSGSFAYIYNQPASISVYAVDPITGLLSATGLPATPGNGIAISPSGLYAWILNGNAITPYSVDASTGALTQLAVSGGTAGTTPTSIAVLPSGAYLYTTNGGSNDVSAFQINTSTGALTALSGSPFPAGGTSPQAITFTPSGKFAFVANSGSHNVSAFTVAKTVDGSLSAVAGSPFNAGNGVDSLTTDPTGNYLYATNSSDDTVSGFSIDPVAGGLTGLSQSPYHAGATPVSIGVGMAGAAITSIVGDAPTSAAQNTTAPIVVTGQYTHFDATTTLNFGSGITVNYPLSVLSPEYITGSITVAADAPLGTRSVTVSTAGESLTVPNGFSVTQGVPVITGSSAVTFPNTIVTQTSTGMGVTVTNTGAGSATLGTISLTGTDPGDFAISNNTCGTTLGSSASCQVTVTFTPLAAGTRSATLTVPSDASNSPLNVGLSGTGVAQTYLLSVTSLLSFPSEIVGQSSSAEAVTISNTGNSIVTFAGTPFTLTGANTGDFVYNGTTCGTTLSPGFSCSVSYVFSPQGAGSPRTATLNISDNASNSPQVSGFSGVGIAVVNTLQLNTSALSFPTENVGSTSGSMGVNVTNNGNTAVTFGTPNFSGANPGDFAPTNTCTGTLAVNATCSVSFTFTPGGTGSRTATYNLVDSASNSPQAISLNGTGQAVVMTISQNYQSFNFNTVNVGATSTAQTVTLTSTGNATVTFNANAFTLIGANPGDFTITNNTCGTTLAVGTNCAVSVAFAPTVAGTRSATLNIADNAGNNPQQVTLSGTGQVAVQSLSFNVNNLNFGAENVGGTTGAQSVTVTSSGNSPVTLTAVTLIGSNPSEFNITNNTCSGTLGVNAQCAVTVTFTPAANGARSASIQFTDSATGNPQTILLTGTGQSATQSLVFNPENLVYGVYTVGAQASSSVTVENVGTASVSIASVQLNGPDAADFSVTGNTCTTLAENATCSVSITFSPTAAGPRVANLQVNDNAPGSPHNVPLLGTGQAVTQTVSQSVTNITYGVTNIGATGNNSFALYNLGTGSAILEAPVLGGANPGDFGITSSCPVDPAPFTAGANCTVSVSFTPTAGGVRVATVTVTDNTPESPHVVMLTGTGQSITSISSQSVDNITYGVTNVGATANSSFALYSLGTGSVTFAAPVLGGANPGDFNITSNNCGTVGSGGSCTIGVSFTPTAAGVRTATVTVTDNTAQSPHVVTLTGTGQLVTSISSQSVTNITYIVTNVGATASSSFALYSLGTGSVTFAVPVLGGANPGDFNITSNNCGTVVSEGNCTIGVSFTPTAAGVRTATVTVTDNTAQSPHVVTLTGTGQLVTSISSQSVTNITYGVTNVGATASSSFALYSLGTGSISIGTPTLSGANPGDFSISSNSCPATLGSQGNCTIGVSFTPTAAGVRTATVTVTDNTAQSPHVVQLTGTGQSVTQSLSFSVGTVAFGAVNVGATTNSSFAMYNLGTGPITVSSYVVGGTNPGDFNIYSNGCPTSPSTLSSGNCTVSVSFTPAAPGVRTATVTMTDNATGSPQVVNLVGTGQSEVQDLSFNFATSDFGVEPVGSTSSTNTITATLNGNASISFSSVAITGTNAADFSITSNGCTGTLANNGNTCSVSVNFTPSATGERTASLQFTDTASGSPQNIALTGVGETVTQTLVPSTQLVVFPATNDPVLGGGSNSSFYITNTGDVPVTSLSVAVSGAVSGDFTSNNCPATLAPGAECTVNVTFTPPAASVDTLYTATVQVTSSANPVSVQLFGIGLPTSPGPAITFSVSGSSDYNFGGVALGSSAGPVNVTVTNTTGSAVTLSNIAIAGPNAADFTLGSGTCLASLPANSNCTEPVTFTPSALGQRIAAIQVTDTGSGSPHLGGLAGTAVASPQVISTSAMALDFGVENVGGTSGAQTVTITNTGTAPTTFTSFTFAGANPGDFGFSNNQCASLTDLTLTVGASCNISMGFIPSASGVRTATLQITDNATGSPQSVMLSGDGQTSAEVLTVTTPALAFGATNDGVTTSGQQAYVKSTGTATVTFSSITITGTNAGDFSITTPAGECYDSQIGYVAYLPQNNSCYVTVTFTPTAVGVETATLNFNDDAPGSPHTVALTGVGQGSSTLYENLVVTTPTLAFGTTNDGVTTGVQTAYVKSTGTATVTFSSITITGTNAGDFSITTPAGECYDSQIGYVAYLPQNNSCYVNVTFTPTGTGVETATLNFNDDAPGSPHTVNLTGVGQGSSGLYESLIVTTPTLAFGTTNDGVTTGVQTAYVRSTGTATVTFSSITITGQNAGDFSITTPAGECYNPSVGYVTQLPQNNYCYVNVTFTPTTTGVETATLNFNDDASGSPHTVNLTGVGQGSSSLYESLIVTTPTLAFGTTNDGVTTGVQTGYVRSTGTATVTFSSITITGQNAGDFSITTPAGECYNPSVGYVTQLPQNNYCYVNVTFTPTTTGVETATLNFNDDAPGSPHTVTLTGVGQGSSSLYESLIVTTPTLAFGTTNDGVTTGAQAAYVRSTGTAPVTFSSFTITGANAGDFSITTPAGDCYNPQVGYVTTLPENNYCYVSVTFTPTTTGAETATLNFNDDAPGSPHTVNLTGVGQGASTLYENLVVTTPTLAFAATNDGTTTSAQAAYVRSTGTATVNFSSFTITGQNAGDFSITTPAGDCYNPQVGYVTQLPQNNYCYVTVVFSPSTTGAETATLNFNDNAPGSPHTVLLTGFGQALTTDLSVATPTLTYAARSVNTTSPAQSAYVLNTGTGTVTFTSFTIAGANPGDFAITFPSGAQSGDCYDSSIGYVTQLPEINSCYVQVSFKPLATGTRNATLEFFSNAVGSPQIVTLTGTGQ